MPTPLSQINIIGQGIAGSCLAYLLLEQGHDVQVIRSPLTLSTSQMAAGLIQPLSGPYFCQNARIKTAYPLALSFYKRIETQLQTRFLYPIATTRYLAPHQEKAWRKKTRSPQYSPLLSAHRHTHQSQNNTHSAIELYGCYYVDTPHFLTTIARTLAAQNRLQEHTLDLQTPPQFPGITILCLGHHTATLPYYRHHCFDNVAGDIFELATPQIDHLIQSQHWLCPQQHNRTLAGGTYCRPPSAHPTKSGYLTLKTALSTMGYPSLTIRAYHRGIRCVREGKHPLLEQHPTIPNLICLSALGSKGFTLAPALASTLCAQLSSVRHFGRH